MAWVGSPVGGRAQQGRPRGMTLWQPLLSPISASPHRVACRGPRRASQGMWQGEAPRCGTCGTDAAIPSATLQAAHQYHPATKITPGQQTPVTHSASLMDSRGQCLKESFAPGESGLFFILKLTQKPPSGVPALPLPCSAPEPLLPHPLGLPTPCHPPHHQTPP